MREPFIEGGELSRPSSGTVRENGGPVIAILCDCCRADGPDLRACEAIMKDGTPRHMAFCRMCRTKFARVFLGMTETKTILADIKSLQVLP